ncbi:ABC transporter ATP-binding protein [Bacillus pumilus]|uniref:ABC transporter ATP-binding protein n=1 Tax=Bacillus pumilus TaxID=1408 RepID=UPI001C23826D|nr:ABC transporter ATP-binding protein [Bacillus pumilus]MBU8638051.1 ABC transporter ATP-binding protein [Bacillus pumilus]
MKLIEAKELTKIYQVGVQPIYGMHPVSFQIDRGTMNLIKGRSGSGKTTLLNMLAGLDEPTKGQVLFQNSNFYGLSEQKQTRIRAADFGFIFQSFHLLPELKVEDNICLPLLIANQQVDQSYFRELIEVLDITDLIKKYPFQISGGQQQRVAIARALIHRPLVVFADEPTGNLDKKNSERVMKILTNLCEKQKTTIVLVTHDERMIKHPDQILEVEEGRVSIYKGVHQNGTS